MVSATASAAVLTSLSALAALAALAQTACRSRSAAAAAVALMPAVQVSIAASHGVIRNPACPVYWYDARIHVSQYSTCYHRRRTCERLVASRRCHPALRIDQPARHYTHSLYVCIYECMDAYVCACVCVCVCALCSTNQKHKTECVGTPRAFDLWHDRLPGSACPCTSCGKPVASVILATNTTTVIA